jgi:CheY-like chemotaxis protein
MTIKKNLDRGVLLIEKLATYDQQMPEEIPLISPANIIEEVLAVSRVMYTNPRIDFTFVNPLAHPSALIALESTKLYALLKQLIANASGHLTPSSTQTPPLITIELCAPPHQHDVCQRCNATLSGALISLRLEVPTVIDAARLTAKTVMDATQPLTNILDLHCRYGHSRVELMPNCTRVWLYFAVAGHAPTQAQALHLSQPYAPQLKTLAPPTQRRLCVIDDELSICDLLQTELTFLGYAVAVFSESVMALDYINTYAHEIDGAIIDIKMPTISGFDLAQALLTKRPQLPVIFLTGYTRQREIETHLPQGNVFLFQKPHIAADEIHRTLIRFFKDDF